MTNKFTAACISVAEDLEAGKLVPGKRQLFKDFLPCCALGHVYFRAGLDPREADLSTLEYFPTLGTGGSWSVLGVVLLGEKFMTATVREHLENTVYLNDQLEKEWAVATRLRQLAAEISIQEGV